MAGMMSGVAAMLERPKGRDVGGKRVQGISPPGSRTVQKLTSYTRLAMITCAHPSKRRSSSHGLGVSCESSLACRGRGYAEVLSSHLVTRSVGGGTIANIIPSLSKHLVKSGWRELRVQRAYRSQPSDTHLRALALGTCPLSSGSKFER